MEGNENSVNNNNNELKNKQNESVEKVWIKFYRQYKHTYILHTRRNIWHV